MTDRAALPRARTPFVAVMSTALAVVLATALATSSVTAMNTIRAASAQPPLALAKIYRGDGAIQDYLISEKLDGVRAYWDGARLISRGGNVFAVPAWFTQGFPAVPLDGELWLGRGSFAKTLSIVSRAAAHPGWRDIRFMAFDLPAHGGTFAARDQALEALISAAAAPYLHKVKQFTLPDKAALEGMLARVTKDGGEGLILRRKDALHKVGRSDDYLKLKTYYDAEARVVAHNPGQGRLTGMLGSITVETPAGLRFKIGTGFTDEVRRNPPPLGSTITYRYSGFTHSGKPRFPSFLRMREAD